MSLVDESPLPDQHDPDPARVARLAATTARRLAQLVQELNCEAIISHENVRNVAFYTLRDLERLSYQQGESISASKLAGYWAFWVRKLKPVSSCFPVDADPEDYLAEVSNVNEVLSLELGLSALLDLDRRDAAALQDPVRSACALDCDGRQCLAKYATSFFEFNNRHNQKYITYSMRYRTFGPHHFSSLFDSLIFGGCDNTRVASSSVTPDAE